MAGNTEFGLVHSISSVYRTAKLFGLAPVTFKGNSSPHWKVDTKSLLYSFAILLLVSCTLYPVVFQTLHTLETLSSIGLGTYYLSSLIFYVTALLPLIRSTFYSKGICQILLDFASFDNNLLTLGIRIDYGRTSRRIRIANIIFLAVLLLFNSSNYFIHYVINCCPFDIGDILVDLSTALHVCINTTSISCLLCLMYLIHQRFTSINNYIGQLNNFTKGNNTSLFVLGKVQPNEIFAYSKYLKQQKIHISIPLQDKLFLLSKMYGELCTLTSKINKLYSLQMLLVIGNTFVDMTDGFHMFYLVLSGRYNDYDFYVLWLYCSWEILDILMLFIITYGCSKMKYAGEKMRSLIHRIPLDNIDNGTKRNVEMLSLQMIHQEVSFTTCGLFPVDLSALYMVIGNVATYLIFLIQFEMASSSPTQQPTSP